MPKLRESCPVCGIEYLRGAHPAHDRARSQHHVLPRRHFGKNRETVELCRRCHNRLETFIPFKRVPTWFYYWVADRFMKGELQ
jgi:hypothetical protein